MSSSRSPMENGEKIETWNMSDVKIEAEELEFLWMREDFDFNNLRRRRQTKLPEHDLD